MIKDEEDIIYENLVWHFCVGFRKFVIIDNNSNDNTRVLIEKFKKQVLGQAIVIIVDDPMVEYIQSKVTTGAMLLAHSIWPQVDWVFPVDADEFWYPRIPLQEILAQVPSKQTVIFSLQYSHRPIQFEENITSSNYFYNTINHRLKELSRGLGKVVVRPNVNTIIAQGNHSATSREKYKHMHYAPGNKLGLDMRHFEMRSTAQVAKKYLNGAKANILGQKLGLISEGVGVHWTAFKAEVDEKGLKQAAIDRFQAHTQPKKNSVDDPLPIPQAFELFKNLTAK